MEIIKTLKKYLCLNDLFWGNPLSKIYVRSVVLSLSSFDLQQREGLGREKTIHKKKEKERKRTRTFVMAFPPLQEATSHIARLQFFHPYEPLLQTTLPWTFMWSCLIDGLINFYRAYNQKHSFSRETKLTQTCNSFSKRNDVASALTQWLLLAWLGLKRFFNHNITIGREAPSPFPSLKTAQ